ncbi:MAG: hypothetical protein FJ015_01160 [Chloroflexi bacterium]|nr:hypothetical protein [Chloroflexota bacterium]
MKISKRSWFTIGIGLFLIAFAGLWMVYSQQADVNDQLKEELAQARTRLNSIQVEQLPDEQSKLEQQLEATLKQSESARATLSQPMNSIIISDILFRTAEAHSVNITSISASVANRVTLDGVPCWAFPVSANIKGEVANLVGFITELNGDLAVINLKTVSLNIPTGGGEPSASIQIEAYTYEGS